MELFLGGLRGLAKEGCAMEYKKQRIILNAKLHLDYSINKMKKQTNKEVQAIMNLLYIGDDDQHSPFNQTFARKDFGVLKDNHNKIKSNTIHLRTFKKSYGDANGKVQSLNSSFQFCRGSSQNKENLKKILKKLENSPSPTHKKKQQPKYREFGRIQTQISEPSSKSRSKCPQSTSLEMTKKSLNKFFDKKKDKELIKSLIKAKIVEKLRRVEVKKNEKKVYNFGIQPNHSRTKHQNFIRQQRPSVLKTSKSKSPSTFLNLLWQQKKMNNPVLSRKTSKRALKHLLF